MSERIRINYTIKLKDMEAEVKRLFVCVVDELASANATYIPPSDILSLGSLELIQEMRSFVYDTEQRLSDIETLVKAYLHYTTQPSTPVSPPEPSDSIEQLQSLKAALDNFHPPTAMDNEITD